MDSKYSQLLTMNIYLYFFFFLYFFQFYWFVLRFKPRLTNVKHHSTLFNIFNIGLCYDYTLEILRFHLVCLSLYMQVNFARVVNC